MSKQSKLREILRAMNGQRIDFGPFDSAVSDLKKSLEQKIVIPTLDNVNSELDKFLKKANFDSVLSSVEGMKTIVNQRITALSLELENKISQQEENRRMGESRLSTTINTALTSSIDGLKYRIEALNKINESSLKKMEDDLKNLDDKTQKSIADLNLDGEVKTLEDKLDQLRLDILGRISRIGGGAMNRQMLIGGVDYLTRYTDINFIAGSGITITAVNDNTKKRVNVTITSNGGGGGVQFEDPTGTIDDSNMTFTVVNTPVYIIVNGATYTVGTGLYASYSAPTITLTSPVGSGGFIKSAY